VEINSDFVDLLRAFNAEGVEFLIVGAYAVGAHGRPRGTGDLDVFVRPSRENAERVLRALATFGAPIGGLTVGDLTGGEVVFQIGVVPVRIDVLTSIAGVSFDECWPGRVPGTLGGVDVGVIGRADLIKNKRAAGRTKDLADVEALLE
jgi:hypothetical protein